MLDLLDRKLILELQKDGRKSYADLAKVLNVSLSTVARRVERLQNEGVIRIGAQTNPRKVGLTGTALVAIDADLGRLDSVCEQITAIPNVHYTAVTFGRWDLLVSITCETPEDLLELIKGRLAQIDGVRQVETLYIAEIKKRVFDWIPIKTPGI